MHLFFAVVAKQYLSQRLWQFPLLFRRNSGLGLLQFLFLWQMMKSYKVWDVLLPEISGARGLFYCFFWPEALLCTTRIFTKKSCKEEAFCTLVNKVWIFRQFCTTLGVEKSKQSWLECLFSKSSKTDPISRKTTHTETSKGRLFLMLSTEMFVEYCWRKQQKREAFWMGHLDRKLHMLHLQNVQPTSKKSLRFSFRLKKNLVWYVIKV